MADYPDNLPVCWWTPSGYAHGRLPEPFVTACRCEGMEGWRKDMEAAGYEAWLSTDNQDFSNYAVTAWRHEGDDKTKPHLACELWDCNQQLSILCVAWEHMAAFTYDKWPEIVRNQRTVDEPSLNKAIIAYIRHGHGDTTIDRYGMENLDERNARIERHRFERAEREAAKKAAASSPKT